MVGDHIQSFDLKNAREVLGVPTVFSVEYMIAIGRAGKAEDLPAELRSRERPGQRRPLSDIAFSGKFQAVCEEQI
jgi:hypothetical protein